MNNDECIQNLSFSVIDENIDKKWYGDSFIIRSFLIGKKKKILLGTPASGFLPNIECLHD